MYKIEEVNFLVIYNIKERLKVEYKLKEKDKLEGKPESEEIFKSSSSIVQDAVIQINEHGLIIYWNKSAEKFFGLSQIDVLNKNLHQLIAPQQYLEAFKEAFTKFRKFGQGTAIGKTLELKGKKKNGEEFPIELSLSSFQVNGEWNAVGIIRDITKRRKAENKIKERLKELICLYKLSKIAGEKTFDIDSFLKKAINIIPPAWQFPELLYAKITVEGREYKTDNYKETIWRQISKIYIEKKKIGEIEVGYLEETTIFDEGPFLKEERNLINGISEILSGVLELKLTEEKLKQSEAKNLFENSPNAVLLVNFKGIVLDANSTTKKLFGYGKEEFLDKPINNLTDIFPQEVKHFFKLIFRASFTKDFPKPTEFQVKIKSGNFIWVILQASLIKQNAETLIQFIFQDITEKKKGELITEKFKEELEIEVKKRTKELNDALEQQKLYLDQIVKSSQVKTEFMATMSHELRTPLNAIIGFTDLLLEGVLGGLNEEQIDFMNDIKSSAEHQFDMIKRILDISKIESGQVSLNFQKFSLNSTIEQIRSNLKPLYSKKSLKFKVKGLEEELFIVADPIRFKEILLNLISNAIKFTIDGKITLLFKEDYYNWIFKVRDTGIGIANKDFPLIFKEFNRVESTYVRSTPGTGLGLSLTKRLVELHGGEISFFSVLGVGTTFTFNLPKKLASRVK